jgi:hypothetical protein
MDASMNTTAVSEAAPLERALNHLSNKLTDLQAEIGALIGDIRPVTRQMDDKTAGDPGDMPSSPREMGSEVTNYINDIADRVYYQTLLINEVRQRVEC